MVKFSYLNNAQQIAEEREVPKNHYRRKNKKPFDLDVVVLWIAGVAIVVFFIYAQVAG